MELFVRFCKVCPFYKCFSLISEHLCKICSSALQTIGDVLPFPQNHRVQPGTTADGITVKILIHCQLRQWADRYVGSVLLIFLFLFWESMVPAATRKQMKMRWKLGELQWWKCSWSKWIWFFGVFLFFKSLNLCGNISVRLLIWSQLFLFTFFYCSSVFTYFSQYFIIS